MSPEPVSRPYPLLNDDQRAELMARCGLPPMSRWLLSELLDCDGGDALGAYPGREYLARRLGVSVSYIKKLFASLHKGGWIKCERGGAGHLYRYYVRPMAATPEYPPKREEMAATPEGTHQGEWRPRGGPVAATPVSHSIEEYKKTTSRTAGSSQNATRGKRSEKKPGWVVEAGDVWKEIYGGTVAYGEIGKHLKPLVDEHGWDVVRPCWVRYLKKEDGKFTSPAAFAKKFGLYRGDGPTSALGDVDALFAQHQAAGAL